MILFVNHDIISVEYRTINPHVDMADTGARAAHLLDAALQGPVVGAFRQGDYLIPITAQSTE